MFNNHLLRKTYFHIAPNRALSGLNDYIINELFSQWLGQFLLYAMHFAIQTSGAGRTHRRLYDTSTFGLAFRNVRQALRFVRRKMHLQWHNIWIDTAFGNAKP